MIDLAADRAIKLDMEKLVAEVSGRWPEEHMEPVDADMQYGQYGEAVLNLIAISYRRHLGLTMLEKRQIEDLIERMSLKDDVDDLIRYLAASSLDQDIDDGESAMAFLK